MKRIAVLVSLFALGLGTAASLALADPPPGKGKNDPSSPAAACHPRISVILKGTFVSAGSDSFAMNVTRANKHGQALLGSQTVMVDAKTKYRRNGSAALSDFVAGDRLNVQARACKQPSASANTSAPALLAKRVVGHPAQSSSETETTTTSTTITTTSSTP